MPILALLLAQVAGQTPIADLPFERVGNRIYLKAKLNGRAVNAVLDTGAGATVADDVVGTDSGAKKVQEIVAGGAGEKQIRAWIVSNLTLRLDGTEVRQPIQVVLPLAPLTRMEGRPLETILGYDFLNRYRVEVDYAASRVRLFDPKDESVPEGASVLPVEFVQNTPHVKGRIELPGLGVKDVTMMFDTGASTASTLTNRFVQQFGLAARFKSSPEIVLGGGVGGETKGRRIRLLSTQLGNTRLERPVAYLDSTTGGATGKGATYDVLVGGEALRRFTLTLDYAHKRIFLKPNAQLAEPFVGDLVGFALALNAEGAMAVRHIIPSSPASEAGIQTDDILMEIDGKAPASLDEARRALRAATGELTLKMRRTGVERSVVLKPRELVP